MLIMWTSPIFQQVILYTAKTQRSFRLMKEGERVNTEEAHAGSGKNF